MLCNCEMTAVQKTVIKEGTNQGRKFWVCPNSERARCGFFKWDDELGDAGAGSSTPQTLNTGDQSKGECFKVNGDKVLVIWSY